MISKVEKVEADLVVIGTGVAGMTAALGAEGLRVHVLTKGILESGSSPLAQGGVAAAVGRGDSPELHAADTVAAGAGLVDPEVARIVTRDGVFAIERLIEIGAEFDRGARGELSLHREAAHSRHRVLHAHGDATGAELVRSLAAHLRSQERIAVFEHAFASRILVEAGRVVGVVAWHRGRGPVVHLAPRIVLASGGIGQLYRYTTNPTEATGDGLLLAAEAGAALVDVEFVQFHPTALAVDTDPLPLLTEALRGDGATLVDDRGERFMTFEDPAAELAPRDVVARAIWNRLTTGTRVFLDAREAIGDRFPERFPTVFAECRSAGIDPRVAPIPVVPAAHYFMGGVDVDQWGRSSVAGLWACGEVASTGAHGANRLASNSLLEALVFGARVAASASAAAAGRGRVSGRGEVLSRDPIRTDSRLRSALRALAWDRIGVVRDEAGLADAVRQLEGIWRQLPAGASEERNMAAAATLIAAAARRRRESRGAHFRSDFPKPSAAWLARQTLKAEITSVAIEVTFDRALEKVS